MCTHKHAPHTHQGAAKQSGKVTVGDALVSVNGFPTSGVPFLIGLSLFPPPLSFFLTLSLPFSRSLAVSMAHTLWHTHTYTHTYINI